MSLASSAGVASAQGGAVAVLPFQGSPGAKVRQNVQKGLDARGIEVVPLGQVNAVVTKTKGYAKQAAELNASALVRARIRRVEGRWIADTEVRNDKGQRVEKLRASSSSLGRLSNRIVSQLMQTGRMPGAAAAAKPEPGPEPEAAPPAPKEPRLVVRPFKGPQAAKIRGGAVRGLLDEDEKVELYPNDTFVEKAKSLGADLATDGGHVAPAKALAVSGLIEGDVQREDGVWSAYVRLVDGESSKVVSQHFYDASTSTALAKVVRARIGSDFRKDIKRLGVAAPAVVPPAPEAPPPPPAEEPVAKQAEPEEARVKPREERPAAVDIEVAFRMVHRNLQYNDDIYNALRDYTLELGPGMGLKFQYYPGAHFTAGVGAQFGIDFEWESLFKFESTRADGQTFPTESQQFLVGLRWRYPTGRWEPSVALDYGVHTFEIGVSGPPVAGEDNTSGVPGVRYQFVRLAGGFRVGIGAKERFIVGASIGFRGVFSLGGIESSIWFPEAKGNGMDAMLMIGFALPKGFEIRLGGDYRRYWLDLNPVPPDPPYVAGGALDQYWGGSAGVAWRW
ncbi:MAG: hypothetical protein AMJ62_12855 [Myxococcales bacterium SG8_38]|nr:MAG: hypothetical protein AMJ62_12855 [Myxococcales bacterium SG8_38]